MDFEQLMKVLPKDPIKWSTDDVGIWLNYIGLGSLHQSFSTFIFY
jgi:hypothetical protein